jgi:hypothetical protein
LEPDVLGTSMIVVGPSGAGEAEALLRPVVESMSLSALAGATSVVVLDTKGGAFARPGMYDIEIVLGDPESPWGLDPYGAAEGAEEAADRLATAALGDGDEDARLRDGARSALQQAIAAYVAAHGHHPTFAALLDLLDGHTEALAELREALAAAGREVEFERALRTLARRTRRRACWCNACRCWNARVWPRCSTRHGNASRCGTSTAPCGYAWRSTKRRTRTPPASSGVC